ncbi:hypothetical protein RUM44_004846 [Polyplax serrata]|uniref:Uncharacterized protein n=1 Tax=Polyplax serrata TaxID=468196 RepID=A0ABR1B3Z5_POLSC
MRAIFGRSLRELGNSLEKPDGEDKWSTMARPYMENLITTKKLVHSKPLADAGNETKDMAYGHEMLNLLNGYSRHSWTSVRTCLLTWRDFGCSQQIAMLSHAFNSSDEEIMVSRRFPQILKTDICNLKKKKKNKRGVRCPIYKRAKSGSLGVILDRSKNSNGFRVELFLSERTTENLVQMQI